MTLLAYDRLSVRYGADPVVAEASLTVAPGEIVGLVGQSGSGKSTLALAALGLLPAAAQVEGDVRLDGQRVVGASHERLRALRGGLAGMIFQEPMSALNPLMTIGAQVAETLRLHRGGPRRAAWAAAEAALAEVGLDVPAKRYPHELSGGQCQRVAIAIAIAAGPRLLIADEPTTALDAVTQARIMALLVRLSRERGMALLLVSHDLALVAAIADRIVVMNRGRIVEQAPPAQLLASPADPATAALVAAARLGTPATAGKAPEREILAAEGLRRVYRARHGDPVVALDQVSLTIGNGEAVGLIGASGSGKSTLVRALLGLEPLDAGEVRIGGARFTGQRPLRRAMQAVFQDPIASFDPRWTVRQIVAEPLGLLDEEKYAGARAAEVLAAVGLDPALGRRRPRQLSGGQRQRVALARALACRPELILLDEALSALDPVTRGDILDLLADLSARLGTAWLFVSHDLALVARATTRLYVMEAGHIVEEGPTARVIAAPAHPATAALVAAMPGKVRDGPGKQG